jgi:DNA invertase Pin-like site-specific DNA recombinase
MRAALYARVSSEGQAQRGTIASQVSLLEAKVAEVSDELVASFIDDGRSGARIDRPGLDELRDQAQAGVFERVWVLTPDRLARNFAHQMFVLDELARCGVAVCFTDAPPLEDDPQARLLVQVQGVIAEYERAKTAERQRRGKLYKVRAGEAIFRKVPFGYRRVPRAGDVAARLEVYEPEAEIVRQIFDDYVAGGMSLRAVIRRLYADAIRTPTGRTCCAMPPMQGQLSGTGTRDYRCPRRQAARGDGFVRVKSGYLFPCRQSSRQRRSRQRNAFQRRTSRTVHDGFPWTGGCCEGLSCAARAAYAAPACEPRPAGALAGTTTTTDVSITTSSRLVVRSVVVARARSVQTSWTRSCLARFERPCSPRRCSLRANMQWWTGSLPPTINS